jgi:putative drug exporter of the RND superfamily
MFERLGDAIFRYRWWTLALAGLFLAASVVVLMRGGSLTSGAVRSIESERAEQLVEQVLGHSAETSFVVLLRSSSLEPTSPAFRKAMSDALAPLAADPRVASIVTPENAPTFMVPGLVSRAAHSALAVVTLAGDFKQALAAYPAVREQLHSERLELVCTGQLPFMHDLNHTLEHDLVRAELVTFPLALLVLLLVFRTAVAATLPLGVGGLAVLGGVAIVLGLSPHVDIAQYTINVCTLIGLGVAIDYSLFTVSRYREELARGLDYRAALVRTMATAGRVVGFSGLAVGTGLAGLLFFDGSYLRPMGLGGAIVVGLAVLFALTFLPALLAVLGPRIHAGRLPLAELGLGRGLWQRWANGVMRRPLLVLIPTLALLLGMGVPFLHLRMAAADVSMLDAQVEARRGYEQLRRDFPDQAANRLLVAVRFPTAPALDARRIDALYDLSRRIGGLPHVRRVESLVNGDDETMGKDEYEVYLVDPPPEVSEVITQAKRLTVGDQVVLLYVVSDAPPESEPARGLVRAIRQYRSVADGTLLVGGQTAKEIDTTAYILERAPRAVGFVVGTTLLVLFLLLRSVVLPIKAVLMNLVSIAGSFGALVWIFQDGHLFGVPPHPLEPAVPVLLFCCLFGLSMDYEVLLLSRIRECYQRSGDNTQAVAEGLEHSAGLITSAAAIMVAVFGAFALAKVVAIQAVGVGMALAVTLDATLVRLLLVPATMRLFGRLNWWAPRPLAALGRMLGAASRSASRSL